MSMNEEFAPAAPGTPTAGVRQVTPASLAAQRAARLYADARTAPIRRVDALQLAKRAAAAMGLKAAKIAMIDKLFAYSPAGDWRSKHASPIVWPSNYVLARQLGLSVSTTRHHLRGLAAAGLIAHASHPTFQRRGVRDGQGNIVEAFGIDLSPIITRHDELLEIALAYEHDGRERRALSYRRTQLRREIEAILVAAQRQGLAGEWHQFQARLDRLRETTTRDLEQIREIVDALALLRDEVEDAYEEGSTRSKMDTAVTRYRRVQSTAELSSGDCSAGGSVPGRTGAAEAPCPASERKMSERRRTAEDHASQGAIGDQDIGHVSLDLVRSACPALVKHLPQVFDSWAGLRQSGRTLCAAVAINVQVWSEAETDLGPDTAIAALAVTIQRADDGEVASPGAYLRSLVQRGRRGQLRISRSLFALADAKGRARASASLPIVRGFPPGRIAWTMWARMVHEHAPRPTPDVEIVAEAFRAWCRKSNIDLAQPSSDKAFIGFCKKWRPRRDG